jgi:uncharacterized Zn-binding protein involved in type VI secretion
MGQPAARQGDLITAVDVHIVLLPSPGGPVPTPLPHPFSGTINGGLSANVNIMGRPAATVGSTADATPPHIPQGGPFQVPPANKGQIITGSATVRINSKPAARNGDQAMTCSDGPPVRPGTVTAVSTVMIG